MTEANAGEFTFKIDRKGDNWYVNSQKQDIFFTGNENEMWETEFRHRLHKLFVHKVDIKNKTVLLSINGKKMEVQLKDKADQLIERLGMQGTMSKHISEIRSPMPGLIHSVLVAPGDEVKEGEPLIILEAMKMENVIKAPADVVIGQTHVQKHVSVEKNTLLITFK